MHRFLEKRYAIRFCVKLGKEDKTTYRKIKEAYDAAAMDRSNVFAWHKLFREDRETVKDNDRTSCDLQHQPKHVASENFSEQRS
ncbi:hypothetical protein TNCV_3182531 [Trichonephila clavipes]|uniref:Mos1 transposase HTH domain-containing protein n=1 Tax=Trichonephila clavipes TaxID=2585209 RepID=A0A8X6SDX5_TRICX|nr:hypothetical protein TNCV_3182531 [Trichonephila clavipes]